MCKSYQSFLNLMTSLYYESVSLWNTDSKKMKILTFSLIWVFPEKVGGDDTIGCIQGVGW